MEDTHNLGIFQLFGVQSHGEEILEKTTSIEARLTFHLPVLGIHNSRLLQQRSPHREAVGPLEVHIDETSDACSAKRAFGSKHMPGHKICLPQHLYCRRRLWRDKTRRTGCRVSPHIIKAIASGHHYTHTQKRRPKQKKTHQKVPSFRIRAFLSIKQLDSTELKVVLSRAITQRSAVRNYYSILYKTEASLREKPYLPLRRPSDFGRIIRSTTPNLQPHPPSPSPLITHPHPPPGLFTFLLSVYYNSFLGLGRCFLLLNILDPPRSSSPRPFLTHSFIINCLVSPRLQLQRTAVHTNLLVASVSIAPAASSKVSIPTSNP